jgi:hypothetical protein
LKKFDLFKVTQSTLAPSQLLAKPGQDLRPHPLRNESVFASCEHLICLYTPSQHHSRDTSPERHDIPSTHTYRLQIFKEQASRCPESRQTSGSGKAEAKRRDYTAKSEAVNSLDRAAGPDGAPLRAFTGSRSAIRQANAPSRGPHFSRMLAAESLPRR